jgi:CRISPR-associated protein Cmr2
MPTYTAITFSPVQGFIEKSRKLRDLYGSSLILSHLSKKIVDDAMEKGYQVISPGLIKVKNQIDKEGMPNRILLKIDSTLTSEEIEELVEEIRISFISEWKKILKICRVWVETNLGSYYPKSQFSWKREWGMWGENTWEFFWGAGESIREAMEDLETRKLQRNWTRVNWIGESSSLTRTDSIAWTELGKGTRNQK